MRKLQLFEVRGHWLEGMCIFLIDFDAKKLE